MKTFLLIFIVSILAAAFNSCKKCTTCTAQDSSTNEIKFQQKSCSNGPLLNDWETNVKNSYPPPEYNTTCK